MSLSVRRGASIAAAALLSLGLAPAATAAEVVPGAPMRMPGEWPEDLPPAPKEITNGACSQGVPGTVTLPDGSTKEVLISAGHCVWGIDVPNPGTEVYVPQTDGDKLIGHAEQGDIVHSPQFDGIPLEVELHTMFNGPDWGTVALEPGVETSRVADSRDQFGQDYGDGVPLTGVRDFRDLQPWEVSVDNFGQPICKDGQTSGRSCGVQVFRTQNGVWSTGMAYQGGDSGGVNFDPVTGEAIGVTSMSVYNLDRAQPVDVALEDAYGIPDGQVNQHFALPEGTGQAEGMRDYQQDEQAAIEWADQLPDDAIPAESDPFEQFGASVDAAQADAEAIAYDIQADVAAVGQSLPDPVASQQAVQQTQQTVEAGVDAMTIHAQNIQDAAEQLAF